MTLQTSGMISLADVNVELNNQSNSSISMGFTYPRLLADRPSGNISLSDFYGKSWITPEEAVQWYGSNRNIAHNWVHGVTGDVMSVNSGWGQSSSSSTWQYTPAFSGIDSKITTVVSVVLGCFPSTINVSINNGTISSINNVETSTNGGHGIRILVSKYNTNIKNITKTNIQWNHSSANRTSIASVAVLPGDWSVEWSSNLNLSLQPNQIIVGGGTTDYFDGANQYTRVITNPGTLPYHNFCGYWYNNVRPFTIANTSSETKSLILQQPPANESSTISAILTFQRP